jgi:CRP/FNR family transcriptional regulator, cyclic AMP receptor protein
MPASPLQRILDVSAWARSLTAAQRARVEETALVRRVAQGGYVCRKGERADHWIGIVEGLVKMTSVSPVGKPTSFTGIRDGGWFGEGSLLKDEPRRYDIVALRDTVAVYVPRATFMSLLDESVAFNRFLLIQLNERLGQFIALVEHARFLGPDARLARAIASLFNPLLYPDVGPTLQLSQEEIGQMIGMSRQRANQALKRLEAAGLIAVEYGRVSVRSLDGLRAYDDSAGVAPAPAAGR